MCHTNYAILLVLIQGFCYVNSGNRGIRECSQSFYGFEYRGKVSTTELGLTCQPWSSQSPHSHPFTQDHMFPDGSASQAKNYCRNPNERPGGPWCFTTVTTPQRKWDYCNIPKCSPYQECRLTEKGQEYMGNIAVTKSGASCLNLCRNPDGKDEPWCFVNGDSWEYCDVPFCKPAMHCIPESASYSSFVGTLSVTENGRKCQRWSSQAPHKHKYTYNDYFPDESIEEADDYCRNPDGDENGVWCYTTDSKTRWEYCDLPRCKDDCKVSKAGRDYTGTKSTTVNGTACQRWDSQSPHPHNMTSSDRFPDANSSMAENFCRNPDGKEGGPWCYTASEETEWDYCGIPDCPYDTDSYPRTPRAKHVLHIGIDGLHPDCLRGFFGANNIIQLLARRGMYTLSKARTVLSTTSGPGWSTILCAQGVETTGVTSNGWKAGWQGNKNNITPAYGDSYPFPCAFEGIKSQDANIKTAFFYDWPWLRNFANSGIPGSVDYEYLCGALLEVYPICDVTVSLNASQYLRNIVKTSERSYTFVYLGNVDVVGHSQSWCGFAYRMGVTYADFQVGGILNAIEEVGSDDFLVMLTTDHGGGGRRHGREVNSDIRVPLFMRGPGVPAKEEFPYVVQTRDMVPTAADFLGLRQNPWWTGRPLKEAYTPRKTKPNIRK